jgi:hypothetical protein
MTNDFAAVVWRIKLLGFNAIRIQFVCVRAVADRCAGQLRTLAGRPGWCNQQPCRSATTPLTLC